MEETSVHINKANIQPIEFLKEAKAYIGDQFWLFVGIVFVGILIGNALAIILMGPAMCGIYLCLLKRSRGETVGFETLFKGFDYFLESFIATLIITGITLVIVIPIYAVIFLGAMGMANAGEHAEGLGAVAVLLILVSVLFVIAAVTVIQICTMFTYLLIVDRGEKAIPAIKLSIRGGLGNFWGLFLFSLVNGILLLIAAVLCYLPVFLLLPLFFGAIVIVYQKIFNEA